ncbi:iron uptake protein [Pseudoxanthomonas wuyuanensis]
MSRTSSTVSGSPRGLRLQLAARMAAAVLGGYAFAWGFIATAASVMFAAGMGFHDAEFLASMLGVLAFLVVFLWAFAARRLWVVWAVLAGGGALLAAAGSLVQSWLV